VAALVFAVLYELRKERPIVDFRLMKDRTFAVSILMLFVLGFVLYGSLALLPIFLQTLLGYTALLSGWVLSPGGLAVMCMMPIVAMLLKKVDTRWLIGFGFFACGLGLIQMSGFNLQVDFRTAMWSRVVQSLGFAFLFIPINVSAFQHIPPDKTAYATGLMNLVRNIGGSTGIALATTMLARRSQFHQANLIGHLSPGNPAYQGFLDRTTQLGVLRGGLSPADAGHLAQGAAYGTVVKQSSMMAFADTFWFMGILCFCLFPMLFLMRRSLATGPVHVD
jgi:DHA2 family multidrug resistance protein